MRLISYHIISYNNYIKGFSPMTILQNSCLQFVTIEKFKKKYVFLQSLLRMRKKSKNRFPIYIQTCSIKYNLFYICPSAFSAFLYLENYQILASKSSNRLFLYIYFIAAFINPINSGCGLSGLDLNSG